MMLPFGSRGRRRLGCRSVGRILQAYLDGELADSRALLVAEHLDTCLRCGMDAHTYRWLTARLAELNPAEDVEYVARLRRFADALASQGN